MTRNLGYPGNIYYDYYCIDFVGDHGNIRSMMFLVDYYYSYYYYYHFYCNYYYYYFDRNGTKHYYYHYYSTSVYGNIFLPDVPDWQDKY